MTRLNDTPVPRGDSIPGVGPRGTEEIAELRGWLQTRQCVPHEPDGGWRFRPAPSIVTRSEAELFSVSSPRFAARVYLDVPGLDPSAYFINARRLERLCACVPGWSRRQKDAEPAEDISPEKCRPAPRWRLRNYTCVADCVIPPPKNTRFHVLTTPLSKLYGEIDAGPAEARGLPFLRYMRLSGGLCAQAVCFMATTLLHEYAQGAHGVADITLLAARGGTKNELPLKGLVLPEMAGYFRSRPVGLNATCQFPAPLDGATTEDLLLWHAIEAYLQSDMPVVFPVDAGRVAIVPEEDGVPTPPSIFKSNGIPRHRLRDPKKTYARNHVVLLVGCDDDYNVLINDTANFPLMEATIAQLRDCRLYELCDEKMKCFKQTVPMFLPVVAAPVQLPVQTWFDQKIDDGGPGLLKIAQRLQTGKSDHGLPRYRLLPNPHDPGVLRLIEASKLQSIGAAAKDKAVQRMITAVKAPSIALEALVSFLSPLAERQKDLWCWIQCSNASTQDKKVVPTIWVWDATQQPPDWKTWDYRTRLQEAEKYLLGVLVHRDGVWKEDAWRNPRISRLRMTPVTPGAAPQAAPNRPKVPGLKPAAISSFSVKDGLKGALECWPDKRMGCELYTFLEKDAEDYLRKPWRLKTKEKWRHLCHKLGVTLRDLRTAIGSGIRDGWSAAAREDKELPRLRGPQYAPRPSVTALEFMAALADKPAAQAEAADKLHAAFEIHKIPIIGFATFFPEIVSSNRKLASQAERAMRFLLGLAHFLKKKGHPVKTIEIVAGSLIDGIWPARDKNEPVQQRKRVFVANRVDQKVVFNRLIAALGRVLRNSSAAADDITLCIELEPGPLYAVRDDTDLRELVTCIQKNDPWLAKRVKLNLDVAHWTLIKSCPRIIGAAPGLIDHIHISDHALGHYGDLEIGTVYPMDHFWRWLSFGAASRGGKSDGDMYASVELEAVADTTILDQSARALGGLIYF